MKKFGKKLMVVALAGLLGATSPIALPNLNTVTEVNAATVKLSASKLNLKVGETKTLKVKGTKGKITWSTNKKSVATVSKSGKVTAKKAGKAKITAKVNGKSYTCNVTVVAAEQEVKVGDLTCKVPSYADVEYGDVNGMKACVIRTNKDDTNHIIQIYVQSLEGMNMSADDYTEMAKSNCNESQKILANNSYAMDKFSLIEEKSSYDKMITITYNLMSGDKLINMTKETDIYHNEISYTIVVSEVDNEDNKFNEIENMFYDTYKISK